MMKVPHDTKICTTINHRPWICNKNNQTLKLTCLFWFLSFLTIHLSLKHWNVSLVVIEKFVSFQTNRCNAYVVPWILVCEVTIHRLWNARHWWKMSTSQDLYGELINLKSNLILDSFPVYWCIIEGLQKDCFDTEWPAFN